MYVYEGGGSVSYVCDDSATSSLQYRIATGNGCIAPIHVTTYVMSHFDGSYFIFNPLVA